MPKTDSKLKLQVARMKDRSLPARACDYVIGLNLYKDEWEFYTDWLDDGDIFDEIRICPKYFHRLFQIRLRPGEGPITIADEDNPLALPVREAE